MKMTTLAIAAFSAISLCSCASSEPARVAASTSASKPVAAASQASPTRVAPPRTTQAASPPPASSSIASPAASGLCAELEQTRIELEKSSGRTYTTSDAIDATVEFYREQAGMNGATGADLDDVIADVQRCG